MVNLALLNFIRAKTGTSREPLRLGHAGGPILFFQRYYFVDRNGQGGFVWTFRATCSKGCRPLNFFQEHIKPVSANDLHVISLFHGGTP